MKNHIQIVAALHIAMGALLLLGAIAVFAFLGMAGGIVVSQGEHEAGGIIGVVAAPRTTTSDSKCLNHSTKRLTFAAANAPVASRLLPEALSGASLSVFVVTNER